MSPESEKWKSLAQPRVLLKTRIGGVLSEPFRCLRTGAESEYISFKFPDWVVVLAETPDKKLLVVRQFRHGLHKMQWEIPGGCMDQSDSSPVDAAIRELREETGFEGENAREIACCCPNPAIQSNFCHTVMIENVRRAGPAHPEDTEDIETFLFHRTEVLKMIRSGLFENGVMIGSLFYYFLDKGVFPDEKCL